MKVGTSSIFIFVSSVLRCAAGCHSNVLPCIAGARVMLLRAEPVAQQLLGGGGGMEKLLFKAPLYVTIERKEGS